MTTSAQASSLRHPPSFGVRLHQAMRAHGPLCAGVDPHRGLMQAWGLDYTVAGLERFAMTCAEAFAEAFLGKDAPEPPDAITLSPYLGYGSLRPAIDLAHATGRGVFVLALTSNPEGADVQHAVLHGQSVAGHVVAGATADNADAVARGELGSVGLVVGATVGDAVDRLGLDLAGMGGPFLAPGVGAQGGTVESLRRVFGTALPHVLAASSREVLSAGPSVAALATRAQDTAAALAEALAS